MLRNIFFYSLLVPYLSLQVACTPAEKPCVLATPTAIFDTSIPNIQQHKFEIQGNSSSEFLILPELALNMTILQSGCEEVMQEFRIELDGTINEVRTAAQTARLISEIFANIADIKLEKLGGFLSLAQLLGEHYMSFNQFSEPISLTTQDNKNLKIEVTKMNAPTKTLLTLIMRVS